MTTRLPLMFGQLNDGVEAQFPTSDVQPVMDHAHAGAFSELDRRLIDQLPGHLCFQGPETDPDQAQLGIAIRRGTMTVNEVFWAPLTSRHYVLVVRVVYHGCSLSLFTTKRPSSAHSDLWPTFDNNLGRVTDAERALGRGVIGGLDANQANPMSLEVNTHLIWTPPRPTSMVGVLRSRDVWLLATTALPTTGEHAPTLAWLRVQPDA